MRAHRALVLLLILLPSFLPPLTVPAEGRGDPRTFAAAAAEATLLEEEFASDDLHARGWSVEILAGTGDGFVVAEGAARTAPPNGRYPSGLDARLRSPPLDLRAVPGSPLPASADGARVETDPAPVHEAWNAAAVPPPKDAVDVGGLAPPLLPADPPADRAALDARSPPAGLGHARLVLHHRWDFEPADGAYAEIRAREPDGRWTPWRPLDPGVPAEERAATGGLLPTSRAATHTGALPDGAPAFTGASGTAVRTVYPLEAHVGSVVQVAFRARSAALVPPRAPGWEIDRVELRAALGAPDVAVEAIVPLADGAAVAVGSSLVPAAVIRNWGNLPVDNVTVFLSAEVGGNRTPALEAVAHVRALAPGEARPVPWPAPLPTSHPTNLTLRAELVSARPDGRPSNDVGQVAIRIGDEPFVDVVVRQPLSSVVTGVGEAKAFVLSLQNEGNVALAGEVSLLATPVHPSTGLPIGPPSRVAAARASPPPPASPVTGALAPIPPPVLVALKWTPGERGAFTVVAAWEGVAASPPARTYVDLSPPPLLDEDFAPPHDPGRPYAESSIHLLPGWSFTTRNPRDAPSPATGRQFLQAEPRDALASATWRNGGGALARGEEGVVPIDVRTAPLVPVVGAGESTPANLSAGGEASWRRLLLVASPLACGAVPVECADPARRVTVLPLAEILNASVHEENLAVEKRNTSLTVEGAAIRSGDREARFLYVLVDARVDPGLAGRWGAVEIRRPGESGAVVPAGELRLYDDGAVRCCVLGPLTAADLLGPPPEALAAADGTRFLSRWTTARPLADLLSGATPGAQIALSVEHAGRLPRNDSAATWGAVEIDTGETVFRTVVENTTTGWSGLLVPLPEGVPVDAQVRFALERRGAPAADARWQIDGLRAVERSREEAPWRRIGGDDLDGERAADPWTGFDGAWSFVRAPRAAPHAFSLADGRLRWGDPDALDVVAREAAHGVARTPLFDLAALSAPTLSLTVCHDLGDRGAAFVAAVLAREGEPEERVLLLPAASSHPYDGDAASATVAAAAVRVPSGASATAWTGRSEECAPALFDLSSIAARAERARVAFELHAAATGPTTGKGFLVDDLRLGEIGPAHDLSVVSATPGADPGVAPHEPILLTATVADRGRLPTPSARVEIEVVAPSGAVAYPAAALPLPKAPFTLTWPDAWTPREEGVHTLRARVLAPSDERAANDVLVVRLPVRNLSAATLAAPPGGILGPHGSPAPGEALDATFRVENRGTTTIRQGQLTLALDVLAGEESVLASPVRVDVASRAGRAVRAGAAADLEFPAFWIPPTSGTYRLEARLEGLASGSLSAGVTVEERLDLPVDATGASPEWSTAGSGARFSAENAALAPLALATVDTRPLARAAVELDDARAFESGFDGGRLEASVDGGPWRPVAPVGGYGTLHAPTLLDEGGARAPALTGSGDGARFDLASLPDLRQAVPLVAPHAVAPTLATLGPKARAGAWYSPDAAPGPSPASMQHYVQRDVLAFPIASPPNGTMGATWMEWRALGRGADADAPASAVLARIEADDGERWGILAEVEVAPRNRYRDWTPVEVSFPGALEAAAGRPLRLVIEHRLVVPAAGLATPNGGVAVADVASFVERDGARAAARLDPPAALSVSAWIGANRPLPAPPADGDEGGFAPLAPLSGPWALEDGVLLARPGDGFDTGRAAFPLDLTAAVGAVTLVLRESRVLALLGEGAVSFAALEVSTDGGATWKPAPHTPSSRAPRTPLLRLGDDSGTPRHSVLGADPEADSAFGPGGEALGGDATVGDLLVDLSAFAGQHVLVALHASFAGDRDDEFWQIEAVRVDAEILKGADVALRLVAVTDATGASEPWEIRGAALRTVRHGAGLGLRVLEPAPGPLTQGYRALVLEAANRGTVATAPANVSFEIVDGRGLSHYANRSIPALPPGGHARVAVRGGDVNWFLATGEPASLVRAHVPAMAGESLLADNRLELPIGGPDAIAASRLVVDRLRVAPQAAEPGETARIEARVRVAGEDPAFLASATLALLRNGTVILEAQGDAERLRAGANETIDVAWELTAPEPGIYDVRVTIETGGVASPATAAAPLFVSSAPFASTHAYAESFTAPRAGWRCLDASPCLAQDTVTFRTAPASLAVGSGGAEAPRRVVVESPPFPAEGFPTARLALHVRHVFGAGQNATLTAVPLAADGTRGAAVTVAVLAGRSLDADRGAFVPLARDLPSDRNVRAWLLRIDAPVPAAGEPVPLQIDDVAIAPVAPAVDVPVRPTVRDGVEKAFSFRVENHGGVTDLARVELADPRGRPAQLPANWSVSLLDEEGRALTGPVAVPPGGVGLLVSLRVPLSGAGGPLTGSLLLPFHVESLLVPGVVADGRLEIEAAGRARADLAILDVRPAEELSAGRARTVEVAIANRGAAGGLARLEIEARPPAESLLSPELLRAPTGRDIGETWLASGERRVLVAAWIPSVAGDHVLKATVRLVGGDDATPDDNAAERTVVVPPPRQPDLRARLRFAEDDVPLGAALRWEAEVENAGSTSARDVEVSLRAGVASLLDHPVRVATIEAGDVWTTNGTWAPEIAGPATVVLAARATGGAPEPVATLADNAAIAEVLVRADLLRVEAVASTDPFAAAFVVRNEGTDAVDLLLEARAPAGWLTALDVEEERASAVSLPPGSLANITVRMLAEGRPRGGSVPVTLVVAAPSGAAFAAPGAARVPDHPALAVAGEPAEFVPSSATITLRLDNDGNVPLDVAFALADAPARWSFDAPVVRVDAFSNATFRLPLSVPGTSPPGSFPLRVAWRAGNLSATTAVLATVEPETRARLAARASGPAGGVGEMRLLVANDGNARVHATVAVAPSGSAPDLHGRGVALDPGQVIELSGRAVLAPGVSLQAKLVGATVLAETQARPEAFRIDLAVVVEETTTGSVRARVENRGDVRVDQARVDLYAEGRRVASAPVEPLEAGAHATVELPAPRRVAGPLVLAVVPERGPDADPEGNLVVVEAPANDAGFLAAARKVVSLAHGLAVLALVLAAARRRSA